jgi:hypothetical protein
MTSAEHVKQHALFIYDFFNNPLNRPHYTMLAKWMISKKCTGIDEEGSQSELLDGQPVSRAKSEPVPSQTCSSSAAHSAMLFGNML